MSDPSAPSRPWRPELLSGFWFLTSAVAFCGVVLAGVVLAIDKQFGNAGAIPGLVISPDSARTILGSIAGSLITIASLTSSLTIVTLQLLSSQYTPRTVRGFLATRRSQLVLGCFIGIFLYCLVLLVAVREPGDENDPFVPSLGIVVSVVLAVLGLVALVLFLHTMSQTIQVSTMAAGVSQETARAMTRLHDDGLPAAPDPPGEPARGVAVRAEGTGYIRYVDVGLLRSGLSGLRVHVVARPGDFVTPSTTLALVDAGGAGSGEPGSATIATIRRAVEVERERDTCDDPLYGIRQLADIALRALSPGINDPSTAITCLGYLRSLVEDAARRPLPDTVLAGDALSVTRPGFADYLAPMTEVAAYAGSDVRVVSTLLEALDSVADCCVDPDRARSVRDLTGEIRAAAITDLRLPTERARLGIGPEDEDARPLRPAGSSATTG